LKDADLYAGPETWIPWCVNWSAVWVGALASLTASLIFGLLGTALGAASMTKLTSWHTIAFVDVAIAICAAFFAYVVGGWAAGKITGARYSEPTILHAVIAWLVSTPLLVVMLAAGAGSAFGGWYGGLVTPLGSVATVVAPDVLRVTAMAAVTALLVGLIGSVIGGWMASGEPMTLTYYRKRIPKPHAQQGGF
jgi:hypothetical protein